jgi:transcriptional regulator with XRE-family HTH domain
VQQFSPRRLRDAREAAGVRREAVALLVDRSYEAVSSWELGRATPPTPVLAQLAGIYGVNVADLFDVEAVV